MLVDDHAEQLSLAHGPLDHGVGLLFAFGNTAGFVELRHQAIDRDLGLLGAFGLKFGDPI